MSKMFPYIKTDENISILIDGIPKTIPSDDDRFYQLVELVNLGSKDKVKDLVLSKIEKSSNLLKNIDGVEIFYDRILYKNQELIGRLVDVLVDAIENNNPTEALILFSKKLAQNPDDKIKEHLYNWIEKNNMPLTQTGNVCAYKVINNNWTDCHTGRIDNSVGQRVEQDRDKCDSDMNTTCSRGLHGCGYTYLPSFGYLNSSNRVVLIEVNPRDFVAFPTDYSHSKFRCCEYVVVKEIPQDDNEIRKYSDENSSPIINTNHETDHNCNYDEDDDNYDYDYCYDCDNHEDDCECDYG